MTTSTNTNTTIRVLTACIAAALLAAASCTPCRSADTSGAAEDECSRDRDCEGSDKCVDGECVSEGAGGSGASGPTTTTPAPTTSAPNNATCGDTGETCASDPCCNATDTCVAFPSLGDYCAANCTTNGGCQSGCCAPLENGGAVCAPVEFCNPPTCHTCASFVTDCLGDGAPADCYDGSGNPNLCAGSDAIFQDLVGCVCSACSQSCSASCYGSGSDSNCGGCQQSAIGGTCSADFSACANDV